MKCSATPHILVAMSLLVAVSGCSKTPARVNPCNLVSVGEAQLFDSTIAKAQWFPRKPGEANELCVYLDGSGEGRLMLFVFDDKSSNPLSVVRSGMKGASDRVIEVAGVGDNAAAGFASGEELRLFADRSKGGMIGVRVREPVREDDEKFNDVKALAANALRRLK